MRICAMPMTKAAIAAAMAISAVIWPGCSAPQAGDGAPSRTEDSDGGRLARGQNLESEGRLDEAFEAYGSILPGTAAEGPSGAYAAARFRMGRCLEETGKTVDARGFYAEVLSMPNLMASEGDIPETGSIDIHIRKQTEVAMARVGFGVQEFYLVHAGNAQSPARLAAVKSLERMGDERAVPALEACLKEADGALKDAAAKSLERIRARAGRQAAGGGR